MDTKQIVIFTQMYDPQADDVVMRLQESGHEPLRLNTEDIPLQTTLSLRLENDHEAWRGSLDILTNGRVLDVAAIRSIWWRQIEMFALPNDFSPQEQIFAQDEINQALFSLWSSLDCYWINYPDSVRQANWKGGQLQRAARLGFDIPRTLITTKPEDVEAFYIACNEQILYKVLSDPLLGASKVAQEQALEQYATPTTLMTTSELALLDSVRLVPCLFQQYVPKRADIRVVVIGDDLFAAKIHSQEREETRIDWRYTDVDVPCEQVTLPVAIAERCMKLVKSYNLNFSVLDLALTPDDRYFFIENNPNGQFLFLEERVPELRMMEALVSCLIRGANA